MTNKIVVAYGDGIGPEIMESVLQIMKEAKVNLAVDVIEVGEKQFKRSFSSGIAPSSWDTVLNNKVILKAPITTPQGEGYKSLNVTIRKGLDLFANVRPVKSFHPHVKTNFKNLDLVIIRENSEDLYAGIEYRNSRNSFSALKEISHFAAYRICNYAFAYARENGRKKVTCMIKDNIMKLSDGSFHNVFKEVAKNYPEIEAEQMIIDIGSAKIANNPERFDCIVTLNLYGDIISDIAAEISGSVGLAGSANIGNNFAMFEAVHGSAPDIAGQNIANPSGLINAAIMMLKYMGFSSKSLLIEKALQQTLEDGVHTADLYNPELSLKKVGTREFTEELIARLDQQIVAEQSKNSPSKNEKANSEAEYFKQNNVLAKFNQVEHKVLVGVDVYFDCKMNNINEFAEHIKSLIEGKVLQLQQISTMGLKIWPEAVNEDVAQNYDLFQLRFVSQHKDKLVKHNDVCELLAILADNDYDFCKIFNLYAFDGKIGFTLSQGE